MKKMNKKGFTIVELVIVIAVIAILSAVMIPTFSGIIAKSKKSAAEQEAKATYTSLLGLTDEADVDFAATGADLYIVSDDYYVAYTDGVAASAVEFEEDATDLPFDIDATAIPTEAGTYYLPLSIAEVQAQYTGIDFTLDTEMNWANVYVPVTVA